MNETIIKQSFAEGDGDRDPSKDLDLELTATGLGAQGDVFSSSVVDGDFEQIPSKRTPIAKYIAIGVVTVAVLGGAGYMALTAKPNGANDINFDELRGVMQQQNQEVEKGVGNVPTISVGNPPTEHALAESQPKEATNIAQEGRAVVPATATQAQVQSQTQPKKVPPATTVPPQATPIASQPKPETLSPVNNKAHVVTTQVQQQNQLPAQQQNQPNTKQEPLPINAAQQTESKASQVAKGDVTESSQSAVQLKVKPAANVEAAPVVVKPVHPAPPKTFTQEPSRPIVRMASGVKKKSSDGDDAASDVRPLLTVTAEQIGIRAMAPEHISISTSAGIQQFKIGDYLPNGERITHIDAPGSVIVTDKKIIRVVD